MSPGDSDGDGLLDEIETHGVMGPMGRVWYTFPDDPDSDGDGLSDDIEYYEDTEPFIGDTDDDCLDDGLEYSLGTNPFVRDSDGDGYSDYDEHVGGYDPCFAEQHLDALTIAREFTVGFVCGEWGSENPVHGNVFYLGGWMFSGVAVWGDVRDIAHSITSLDALGTVLNGLAFAPVFGDALRCSDILGKFALKHPDRIVETALLIGKYAPWKNADDAFNAVKTIHGADFAERLLVKGVTRDMQIALSGKGARLADVEKLMDTHHVPANDLLKYTDKKVNLGKLLSLLDNVQNKAYTGTWSPGLYRDASVSLNAHFAKHAKEFGFSGYSGDIVQKQEYVDKAISLINRGESVERYYHKADETIVVYCGPPTNEWAQGTLDGKIKTLFKPYDEERYIQRQMDNGQLVKIG
mgnify:CR=1 FL=1